MNKKDPRDPDTVNMVECPGYPEHKGGSSRVPRCQQWFAPSILELTTSLKKLPYPTASKHASLA